MDLMKNLASKKLLSAGGAVGGICYIASLIASGGLTLVPGLILAGLIVVPTTAQIVVQGRIDKTKVENGED